MGKTSIEWTDASWNPIVGCTEVSPGCGHCYAARLAASRLRRSDSYAGLAVIQDGDHGPASVPRHSRWTGEVRFLPERLEEPLHWKKPRRIFVCDMGDLFHESVQDKWLQHIWNIMAQCQQHTFQVLTKRAARMRQWVSERYGDDFDDDREASGVSFAALPNVWLGVSVENQHFADERIPLLLATPAAVRFISAEPLLGPMHWLYDLDNRKLDWLICGGESGPNARPMHPDWARSLRDQCVAAGVPFFFKQWGEWSPNGQIRETTRRRYEVLRLNGLSFDKVGKKKAGRLLDGREWNEFPKAQP